MAFIEKKDPLVVNIKLTSKGRELLSKGRLNFRYYAVGDSEMDYVFNKQTKFNPFNALILRPKDKNPDQLSFISKNLLGDPYNFIDAVPSIPNIIENHVNSIGFFNSTATEFLTDSDHVKQPDAAVDISTVTGGTVLKLIKSPTYQANVNEPAKNDLILIRWTNPKYPSGNTTGYSVNKNHPTPNLVYKIQEIISGSLGSNDLTVEVDRELPDFGGSGNTLAGALVYYNYINYTGDTCFSTDETDDALIAFLQNCQCPTVTFPFWNLSIIFTENIAGVQPTDKQFGEYNSAPLGGFVSYIQNQAPIYKKLGVIHYTNNSVANTYAEGFYGDPENSEDIGKIPTLNIPTIMWHKSSGATLGVKLQATSQLKYVTGITRSLNTRYFDLADELGNVVGKVFYDLKIFVIEDQELLFAMSYKSNRSWTLPNYGVDVNANVTFGCPPCLLAYDVSAITPTTITGTDGKLFINNITNNVGNFTDDQILLKVFSGGSGGTRIYFEPITGDTLIDGLSANTYYTEVIDLGSPNCVVSGITTINEIDTEIEFVDPESTFSKLFGYFPTRAYRGIPSTIRVSQISVAPDGFIGTGYVTITSTGSTNTDINSRSIGTNALTEWVEIPDGGYVETTSLTFKQPYTIYVRDVTGGTLTINSTDVVNTQVWSYHVAVASPFNDDEDIVIVKSSDGGGKYITVSDYLLSFLNPNSNPVIGNIEFSIHKQGEAPYIWRGNGNSGDPVKLYYTETGSLTLTVRERFGFITVYDESINFIG